MAEWWAAASWRKWLVVDVDVLFVEMVMAPLHCAAAQLVAHAWWLPRRSLRRALCDACRRLLPWSSSSWRASWCRAPSWLARAGSVGLCGGLHVRAGVRQLSGSHVNLSFVAGHLWTLLLALGHTCVACFVSWTAKND